MFEFVFPLAWGHNWTSRHYPDDQNMMKQAGHENLSVDMRKISNGPYRNKVGGCTMDSCSVVTLVISFQFP